MFAIHVGGSGHVRQVGRVSDLTIERGLLQTRFHIKLIFS